MKNSRKYLLICALIMLLVFPNDRSYSTTNGGENSNDNPAFEISGWLPPEGTIIPDLTLFLADCLPDTFVNRSGLRWRLKGSGLSKMLPEDFILIINGTRVPADRIRVEDDMLIADIMLADWRNDVLLEAIDASGRQLYYNANLWAGSNTVTISLIKPDGTPFTELTKVTASLYNDPASRGKVNARITTTNGFATFINIPNRKIDILVERDSASLSTVIAGTQNLAKISMLAFMSSHTIEDQEYNKYVNYREVSLDTPDKGFSEGKNNVVSYDIPILEIIDCLPPDEIIPLDLALDLIDGSDDTFVNRSDLRWCLKGTEFSQMFPEENIIIVNGNRVPTESITIEDNLLTANIILADGRNDISLKAYDTFGRPLFYNSKIFSGSNTITVSLINSDRTPFTTQTSIIATLSDDRKVTAQVVATNGVAELTNIPDSAVLISATSVNDERGSVVIVGSQNLVTITMREIVTQSVTKRQ